MSAYSGHHENRRRRWMALMLAGAFLLVNGLASLHVHESLFGEDSSRRSSSPFCQTQPRHAGEAPGSCLACLWNQTTVAVLVAPTPVHVGRPVVSSWPSRIPSPPGVLLPGYHPSRAPPFLSA